MLCLKWVNNNFFKQGILSISMSLLEQLQDKKTLNVDFHNHLQTGGEFRRKPRNFKEKVVNLFLEEGVSDVIGLLKKMKKNDLDVIYITNYEDSRAEDWTSEEQLYLAIQAGYEIEQGKYYTFFKKGKEIKGIGKSQEIPTSQGHVLIPGMERNKYIPSGKSLEEALAEADDEELKIAEHPYTIVERSGTLRRSKNPKEDAKKFDALEENGNFSFFSFPFSIANYLARRAAKKYNKPLVVGSDGHHKKDIGETYNIFDSQNLDYTSERNFRDSINYSIREEKFSTKFTPIPFWRVFHHALMMGIYSLFKKFSLIPKNSYEKYSSNHNLSQ